MNGRARRLTALLATVALAAAAVAAAACGDPGPTTPFAATVTTDSSSYTALSMGHGRAMVKVALNIRNPTSDAITVPTCGGASPAPIWGVELLTPSDPNGAAYNPAWACTGSDTSIAIPPGATRVDTLTLAAPNAYTSSLQPLGAFEGTFRIHYGDLASNTFTITLPQGGLIDTVARDTSATIQTDQLMLPLRLGDHAYSAATPMTVTIRNPSADTVFLARCADDLRPALERQTSNGWTVAATNGGPQCVSTPIPIAPGAWYSLSLNLFFGAKGSNIDPQFTITQVPGIYRFDFMQLVDRAGHSVPLAFRISNPFAIVAAP